MRRLILAFAALFAAGCFDMQHQTLGPSPVATQVVATNGVWPVLDNFNSNISTDNAGGSVGAANDTQDGCGVSSPPGSTASLSSVSTGSDDGTPFLRLTYSVVSNTSCSYQYASVGFPLVSQQNLSSYSELKFNMRSSATVQIVLKTAGTDSCLGAKNSMTLNVVSTGGSWGSFSEPFSSFTPKNGGCPYPLANTGEIDFVFNNAGSGTLDLDNITLH